MMQVERNMGRTREIPNGPRTIDIDIVLFGDEIFEDQTLHIPHPRYHHRNFVLRPLAEICPNRLCPRLGQTVSEILQRCPDPARVICLERNWYREEQPA